MAALLSNWKNVEKAVISANEAEGSASAENAKYIDSMQGRLDKLTTSWQSFANTFMESDFLKGAISGLTGLVEVIEKLVDSTGTLGTIGLGAGIFGIFKNFGTLKTLGKNAFTMLTTDIMESGDALMRWNKASSEVAASGKTLAHSMSAVVSGIGLAVAAIGLFTSLVKSHYEEQARLRQETIETSNAFLESTNSFEQAYIKYSGRTDLTAEEEAELETAINGTVDALNDKSSTLQSLVDGSNDYLKSLELIADAELEAAAAAAEAKKDASEGELKEAAIGWAKFDGSEVDISAYDSEASKILKDIGKEYYTSEQSARGDRGFSGLKLDGDADVGEIINYYHTILDIKNALEESGLEDTSDYRQVTAAIDSMAEAIGVYTDGVIDAAKAQYQLENGIPKTVDEYLKMRETILRSDDIKGLSFDTKQTIAGDLDSEYAQMFDLTSAEAQARKFVGIIKGYGNGTKDGTNEIGTIETFLNLRTAVNNNECTVGDYISQFDEIDKMTEGWDEKEKEKFNSSFGIDADEIKKQYDEVYKYLSRNYLDNLDTTGLTRFESELYKNSEIERIESLLGNLSVYELEAVANLKTEFDWQNDNWDDIKSQIEEEAKYIEAISFSVNLELEAENLENLSTAVTESLSGAGLGTESMSAVKDMFGDLDGYDQSKLFERTANGIRLNSDELRKLNDEYKQTNVDGLSDKIDALGERYLQTREELSNLTYGTDEYNQKARELSDIEAQINVTETLITQYEGLTSAYQTWQRAESAGNQRDMYENVLGAFETVEDELSRGWLDDSSVEFLRLLKGDKATIIDGEGNKKEIDIATASVEDFKKVWKSLDKTIENTSYSVNDFFTTDKDGNSTSKGVYNFLDAVGQLEEEAFGGKDIVKRDKDGNVIGFDFQLAGGDEAIAEALGISEELVQIMVRAADDAGFVVSMDGTYQQLDVLKKKAQEAATTLKDTLKLTDYEFFEDSSKEGVLADYQEALKLWGTFKKNKNADGTVDMTVDGAEEAYTVVSTLQTMVDQLSEPVYMELNASQVEKDMQTPLDKLKQYETLVQTEHQLQLKGTDTSQIKASKEEIINYFDELQENNPEIAAELEIDGLTRDEIQAKVEAGEIEIPATIDLQVEMNNTLRDMVNISLYNAGLLGDKDGEGKTELEKRVDISLYADEVDTSDVEEKTEEAVNGESGEKSVVEKIVEVTQLPVMSNAVTNIANIIGGYTEDEQEVVLKFMADTSAYDEFEAEDKEAVVKFIADSIDVEGYEPEEKEAYAKYIADGGDVSSYTPEQKEAIVKYFTEDSNIDNYEGEDKEAIVKFLAETSDADGYTPQDRQAIAKFIKDSIDVDNYQMPTNKTAYAKYLKDTYDIDIWTPPLKEGGVAQYKPSLIATALPILTGGIARYTAQIAKADGTANVNGTAFANGTSGRAYKKGDWSVEKSETALTGELGQELVVYGGRYWTVGDNGAEFAHIPKGAIVFNHKQTEELFKNGKVTSGGGRGHFYANGTAFAEGTAFPNGSTGSGGGFWEDGSESASSSGSKKKKTNNSNKSNKSNKSNDSKSSSKSAEEFEETLDWIETKISRIERAIDKLDLKANSIYKSWSTRNKALVKEIGKVQDEIALQEDAAQRYLEEANSVGLSNSWAKKVRNGEIDIDTIEDEGLAEKIKNYQEWYNKYLACIDAAEELKEKEAELYAQRFENVQTQYDGILQGYEHTETMLNEYIAQAEEQGYIVSKKYYEALISNEKQSIARLEKEQSALLAKRQEYYDAMREQGMSDKEIRNSEQWISMSNEIDGVTQSIESGTTALLEYDNAMRDIDWSVFDLIQERISDITEEADFLIELMSNDKLFEDDGKLTSQGLATMALHSQNYNAHMYAADEYGAEIAKLDKQIADDPYDQELINRRNELLAQQREMILAAEDEKNAIADMVEEGIELELDALDEKIQKYEEALDSQKD